MSEIAIVSVRKTRLQSAIKKGDGTAKTALKLAENPTRFLSTVQIGITLIGILTGIYSGEKITNDLEAWLSRFNLLAEYHHSIAISIVLICITFFSLVLGELVPKRIGMSRPELIALLMAKPMYLISRITSPFIWLLSVTTDIIVKIFNLKPSVNDQVTEEEIKAFINESAEAGNIEEIEQDIVENVFHMGDRRIGSLMTPGINVTWLDLNETSEKNKEKIKLAKHSVFPVCLANIDKILGIVHVKELLAAEFEKQPFDLKKHLKNPLFVPQNIKAFNVLEKFKETKTFFAIVVDEYGGVMGIVTMNDLLETLVEDADEEYEKDNDIVERANGSFLVDASIPFPDFVRYFEIDLNKEEEVNEFNTLGGLMFSLARSIPKTGAQFYWKGYVLEVADMDGRRIDKVLISRGVAPEE